MDIRPVLCSFPHPCCCWGKTAAVRSLAKRHLISSRGRRQFWVSWFSLLRATMLHKFPEVSRPFFPCDQGWLWQAEQFSTEKQHCGARRNKQGHPICTLSRNKKLQSHSSIMTDTLSHSTANNFKQWVQPMRLKQSIVVESAIKPQVTYGEPVGFSKAIEMRWYAMPTSA